MANRSENNKNDATASSEEDVAKKIRKSMSSRLLRMSLTDLNIELQEREQNLYGIIGKDASSKSNIKTVKTNVNKQQGNDKADKSGEKSIETKDIVVKKQHDESGSGDSFMQRYKLINLQAIRYVACGERITLLLSVEGCIFQFGTVNGEYIPPKQIIIGKDDKDIDSNSIEVLQISVSSSSIESHGEINDHCACIINKPTKNLYTWGSNDCGQLGIGNTSFQGTPQAVREIREKVTFCSCGPKYTIAVTDTNLVYSFGLNSKGQLGLSQNLQRVRKETEVYVK